MKLRIHSSIRCIICQMDLLFLVEPNGSFIDHVSSGVAHLAPDTVFVFLVLRRTELVDCSIYDPTCSSCLLPEA